MLQKSRLFFKRNGSTILTCIGAAGVVLTTVLAIKATPKATQLLEEARDEKGEELTNTEVLLTVGPAYIPTVVAGASTITCIFGANILNKRQQAALTSAYALLNSSYTEYKNKVVEMLGEEANEEIEAEIAKDAYAKSDIVVDEGKELFYDSFSGRYFESTKIRVKEAEYFLNRDLIMRDYVYLNEWYDYLDLELVDGGWELGWSTGNCMAMYWQPWIDFGHSKTTMDDGMECTIISFWQEPIMDFEDYC